MQEEIKIYNNTEFLYISAESPEKITGDAEKNVRAELPSDVSFSKMMTERGYILGDRTIGVTINLTKVLPELDKLIRFDIAVAIATPSTVLFKTITKKRLRITFITPETVRQTRGVFVLPRARKTAEAKS